MEDEDDDVVVGNDDGEEKEEEDQTTYSYPLPHTLITPPSPPLPSPSNVLDEGRGDCEQALGSSDPRGGGGGDGDAPPFQRAGTSPLDVTNKR